MKIALASALTLALSLGLQPAMASVADEGTPVFRTVGASTFADQMTVCSFTVMATAKAMLPKSTTRPVRETTEEIARAAFSEAVMAHDLGGDLSNVGYEKWGSRVDRLSSKDSMDLFLFCLTTGDGLYKKMPSKDQERVRSLTEVFLRASAKR